MSQLAHLWRRLAPEAARARLYSARTRLRSYLPPPLLRWYHNYGDATGLVSFPKCGRTWLRILVGKALVEQYGLGSINPLDWRQLSQAAGLPALFVDHEDKPHQKAPHELEWHKRKFARSRILFLVRDPRDVMVSLYHHEAFRHATYQDSVSTFIRRPKGGIDVLIAYYNIWVRNWQQPRDFMLVHYEDLHRDTGGELRRVLRFLGVEDIDDRVIEAAVAYGDFDNMRNIETQNLFPDKTMRTLSSQHPQALKTRQGRVHSYGDYLDAADINYLNAQIARDLAPFYRYTRAVQ